jgi:hypothetical protein
VITDGLPRCAKALCTLVKFPALVDDGNHVKTRIQGEVVRSRIQEKNQKGKWKIQKIEERRNRIPRLNPDFLYSVSCLLPTDSYW